MGLLLKEDFSVFITIALWKRIATGRRRLIQKLFFFIVPAMFIKLLHRIRPRLAKQNAWFRQAIGHELRMTTVQYVQRVQDTRGILESTKHRPF